MPKDNLNNEFDKNNFGKSKIFKELEKNLSPKDKKSLQIFNQKIEAMKNIAIERKIQNKTSNSDLGKVFDNNDKKSTNAKTIKK